MRYVATLKLPLAVLSGLTVAACGGGGGGGGGGGWSTLDTFTKFSAIVPDRPTRIQGSSQEVPYTWDPVTEVVTSYGAPTSFGPTATADVTVDATGEFTSLDFTSAAGSRMSFSASAGDTLGMLMVGVGAAINAAEDKLALYARSLELGWDYQTFGIWMTDDGAGGGVAGTFSLGALTPVSSIPTLGTATYLGSTMGHYVDPAGTENLAFADMTATVDFRARSIGFNTTSTLQTADLVTISANDNLNLSGTLTYAPGVNQFTGPVTTVGGGVGNAPMTGTATGSFYGPAAEEIGGGFSARGAGVSGYMGAFGGRK